jgi:hypothetical protein
MNFMDPRHLLPVFLLLTTATANAAITLPTPPEPEPARQSPPAPPVVSAPANTAPSDAIVLFDGSGLDNWESVDTRTFTPLPDPAPRWTLDRASRAMIIVPGSGSLRTKAAFGDIQLHIEWRSPSPPKGSGQGRGNSGVFFMGVYELQILDSYENKTYASGQAAAIYQQFPPLVNASRPPGEWQAYDAVFIAPRFNADGSLASPARLTLFHNGVLVHHDIALLGATGNRGQNRYTAHAARLPLILQNHQGEHPVAFRNIWVRDLGFPPGPPVPGIPPPPRAPAKKAAAKKAGATKK